MLVERLRGLLEAATPPPWLASGCWREGIGLVVDDGRDDWRSADATLVAAAVNSLPALLDVAEAAKAWIDSPTNLSIKYRVEEASRRAEVLRDALARLEQP